MSALHLVIHGRVQGVGYRDWLMREARALGLAGWVRNLTDGTVEAVLAGPDEAVRTCLATCHRGPGFAHVSRIESTGCQPPAGPDFVKKTTAARPD